MRLLRNSAVPITAITAMTPPAMGRSGRFDELGGAELVDPTVSDTGVEWIRDPLEAVTLTE